MTYIDNEDTGPYASPDAVVICRLCGKDLPAGGTRRIGICVECVANERFNHVEIPGPRYGRRTN